MKSSRFNHFAYLLTVAFTFSGSAFAANYQWDVNSNGAGLGGAGTWNTTNAFWDNTASGLNDGTEVTTAPTFSGSDTAFFGGTAGAVSVAAVTVGGLNFTSSGYNLTSGTITLGANTTILQTTGSFTNTTTIGSKITGSFKLSINATSYSNYANLTLSGANDYTGGTDLMGNTQLTIGNATALGSGTVTVTSGSFFGRLSASSALTIANNFVLNNDFGLSGSNNVTTNGTLNLGGGAPRSIDVSASRTFTIAGNTSNGALTKTGSGILQLNNSNYTGATTIAASGGTLRLRNSSSSSGFSIASGTNLQLTNLTLGSSQNVTGAGNVSTDASLFGVVTLNGTNNNYTGSTTVTIDKVTLGSGGVISGTSGITVQGQWSSQFANLGTITTGGALSLQGYAGSGSDSAAGIFYNGNSAGTTPGTLNAASITLNSSFRSDTNTSARAKGGEFFNYSNSTVALGSGAITVNGQGNALAGGMVTAGSTFNNAGSVTAGSITLNSSSTANTASNKGGTYTQTGGSTTLSGTATLAANGGTGAAGTAGNDAAFNLSAGTFSAGTLAVNSGTVTATGGTLNLGSGGITKTGTTATAINLGATTLGATAAWNSSVAMTLTNSSTGTTVSTTGGNIGLSGILSGTGKMVKSGSGTLTVSGDNTYTGGTTVSGGVLAVTGNQSSSNGAVSVSNSGTRLVGTGTIGGDTTINANAIHSAGGLTANVNKVGLQTFDETGAATADLTYGAGSIFEWDLNAKLETSGGTRGTDYDAVNVSGNLTADSTAIFRVVLGTGATGGDLSFWSQSRTWSDIFGGGFTPGSGFNNSLLQVVDASTGSTFNVSGLYSGEGSGFTVSGTTLSWSAVPEPTSALAGLLIGAGLLRRRRTA